MSLMIRSVGCTKYSNRGRYSYSLGQVAKSIVLLGVVSTVCLLYLVHINKIATKGFNLRGLEVTKYQLEKQHERLIMEISTLKAMKNIKNDQIISKMVSVENPIYLAELSNVAVR